MPTLRCNNNNNNNNMLYDTLVWLKIPLRSIKSRGLSHINSIAYIILLYNACNTVSFQCFPPPFFKYIKNRYYKLCHDYTFHLKIDLNKLIVREMKKIFDKTRIKVYFIVSVLI